LEHISEGTGDQRHIIVKKKTQNLVENELTDEFRSFSVLEVEQPKKVEPKQRKKIEEKPVEIDRRRRNNDDEPATTEIVDPKHLCRFCRKEVPVQNVQLHEIYCQRVNPVSSLSIEIEKGDASAVRRFSFSL
jgi:hypothetical protein